MSHQEFVGLWVYEPSSRKGVRNLEFDVGIKNPRVEKGVRTLELDLGVRTLELDLGVRTLESIRVSVWV